MLIYDKILSVSSMLYPSLSSSLEGISADLFFIGCKRLCPGCHNSELQEFVPPNTSIAHVIETLKNNKVRILTLMGGEPLDVDIEVMLFLLQELKTHLPDLRVNLYTGYELDEIDSRLLGFFGSIKTGMFDRTQLNTPPSFLASKNQKYFQRDSYGKLVKVYP